MSETPGSTIGFERRFNPLLRLDDEGQFVRELTSSLQPQPPNFERIVELNRGGLLRHAAPVEPLAPTRVAQLAAEGAVVLDGREPREFNAEHVPGSLNVTMVNAAVGTRAAWVADPERDVVVVAPGDELAFRFARMLEAVGFRNVRGYLAGGIAAWVEAARPVEASPSIDLETLARGIAGGELELLDVREADEWRKGHVPGSVHVPYHELRDAPPPELERWRGRTVAVACSAGNRSSLALSLLRRHGVDGSVRLVHVAGGGVADLERHGVALERG